MARRSWRVVALTVGVSMTALGSGLLFLGVRESAQAAVDLDQQLTNASEGSAIVLSEFFDRAVGSDLQLAAEPSFQNVYDAPGSLAAKVNQTIPALEDAHQSLAAIEETYPGVS